MDPKWHIAFCNVTYTEYAGVTYRDYYGSPAVMLEAQLAAEDFAERRWGVGRFMAPGVDVPSCAFSSLFGTPVVEPEAADEIPYLDTSRPPITRAADADRLRLGNPQTDGLMGKRYAIWRYYQDHGYNVGFGGSGGAIVSTAMELTGNDVLTAMYEDPASARRVLEIVCDAHDTVCRFGAELMGQEYHGTGYTGDDFSGLLSPAMYREFAVPCYRRLYIGENRFMHSELLRAEHLRIAREELGITMFHGAGCKNLTLDEMYEIMGESFWTQLTPQEMLELTPAQIDERIREFAGCGCSFVQLYPGRRTPAANMDAAIEACRRECAGGMA
jgi:hypothetical protein